MNQAVAFAIWVLIAILMGFIFWTQVDHWKPEALKAEEAGVRNGMRMSSHLDPVTGCQYLSVNSSAPTPRMGADGKQVCKVTP